jgi:hypothetical protein
MRCCKLLALSGCLLLLGLWGGVAVARDTVDLRTQCETGLKAIAAAEFTINAIRGHYASQDELLEAKDANIDAGIAGLLLSKPDTGVYYNVAASEDGKRFIAVGFYGHDFTTLSINETGTITPLPKAVSAQWMIEQQRLAGYFAAKPQWASEADTILKLQLHQVQLAVERWSTDHSADDTDIYPETLEPVIAEGYIAAGFYTNPVTAWRADELNAAVVALGQWSPGDFSYVPYLRDGACRGYLIAGYGCRRTGGHDYNGDGTGDGIVIVLSSGQNDPSWAGQVLKQQQ